MLKSADRQFATRRLATALVLTLLFSFASLAPAQASSEPAQDPTSLLEWIVEVVGEWFNESRGTIDPNG